MTRTMSRGKQQVLFNHLPNRTFEFERIGAIARVASIRGEQRTELNSSVLLQRVFDEVSAWEEEYRPALRDNVFDQADRFVLLDPKSVKSELFPKVMWCQNRACGSVADFNGRNTIPRRCSSCRAGKLVQLRWVKIHRCGALHPMTPPQCGHCRSSRNIALDTRGSERISNFRWICRACDSTTGLFGGTCPECQWPDQRLRRMDIEVHRAGRTFYPHSTVLLNIPHRKFDAFFQLQEWPAVVAAKHFGMVELKGRSLSEFAQSLQRADETAGGGLSAEDLDILMSRQMKGELSAEEFVKEMRVLRERRQAEKHAASPSGIVQRLCDLTGVAWPTWKRAGREMLEVTVPMEMGQPCELDLSELSHSDAAKAARQIGISRLALVADYPIVTATYGFSRAEYRANQARLNPFPPHPDHSGRFPIFVDQVQADALLVSLDPDRVIAWLERNGCSPSIPRGSDARLSRRAYFVELLGGASLRETLREEHREARMVFGLLHTLSHSAMRHASLHCGLDRTSLSEYLLPRALTFALYCNHRFGATIGALTALFEQSLSEWINSVRESRRCVYDPMCSDRSGNCHACTHAAETSCRFFNLNLSRAFLFGGNDAELGNIPFGYFDPRLG